MTARELKTIRKRLGWSQARLAEAVGVASNSIARQERSEMGIKESLARLIRLIVEQHEPAPHSRGSGAASANQTANGKRAGSSCRKERKGKGEFFGIGKRILRLTLISALSTRA